MSQRTLIALAMAVVLVAGAVYMAMIGREKAPIAQTNTVEVYVAKMKIEPYTQLKEEMIEKQQRLPDQVPPDAVKQYPKLLSQYVNCPVWPGQVFLEPYLEQEKDPLATLVKPGERALAVPVNEASGLSGMIKPGAHVDLVSVIQAENRPPVSIIFLQDVRVLAVGSQVTTAEEKGGGEAKYRTVTLAATPEQVETINMVINQGHGISLTLRARDDQDKVRTRGKTLKDVAEPRSIHDMSEDNALLAGLFGGLARRPKSDDSPRIKQLEMAVSNLTAKLERQRTVEPARPEAAEIDPGPARKPYQMTIWKGRTREEMYFEDGTSDVRVTPGTNMALPAADKPVPKKAAPAAPAGGVVLPAPAEAASAARQPAKTGKM